jgi:hypothetical protein
MKKTIAVSLVLAVALGAARMTSALAAEEQAKPKPEVVAEKISHNSITEPEAKGCSSRADWGRIKIHSTRAKGSANVGTIWFCAQADGDLAQWFKVTGTQATGSK